MDLTHPQEPQLQVGTTIVTQPTVETEIAVSVVDVQSSSSIEEVELAASVALPVTQTSSAASSPRLNPVEVSKLNDEVESGYASAEDGFSPTSSMASLPKVHLSKPHIDFLNSQLENLSPQEILRFSKILFPNLYQSTAFGLTGVATVDMLQKLQKESPSSPPVDLIFLDTLYHFQETHDLVNRVKEMYPALTIRTFKPWSVETTTEFEALYGEKLWEIASEMYDYTVKVEPLERAYDELKVAAVITGRRRSQGGARDKIRVMELDEERDVVKINPMANWTFTQVREYIRENELPYNALLDKGYKSVGDWHSTSPVGEGEDERAGRWKGQSKTECGIHNNKSRYAQFLEMERKEQDQKAESVSAQLVTGIGQGQVISVA